MEPNFLFYPNAQGNIQSPEKISNSGKMMSPLLSIAFPVHSFIKAHFQSLGFPDTETDRAEMLLFTRAIFALNVITGLTAFLLQYEPASLNFNTKDIPSL